MTQASPRFRSSIERRLPTMVGGLLLLVSAALAWAAYVRVSGAAEAAAAGRLSGVTAQLVSQLGAQMQSRKRGIHHLAGTPAVLAYFRSPSAAARAAAWPAAQAALTTDTTLVAVELWDTAGAPIETTAPSMARLVSPQVLAELRSDASGADSAAVGRLHAWGDTTIYPVVGAVTAGGRRLGYAVQWNRVQRNPQSREQTATLFGSDAVLYIGSTPGAWTDQRDMVTPPPLDSARLGQVVHYQRPDAGARIAAGALVAGAPWIVALEFSEPLILAPARQFLNEIALIALGVFALGLLVAWRLSRQITVPLRDMTAFADARVTGQFTGRVPAQGADELGRLARAFNQMADHVDEEVAGRQASEAQWRLLFKSNPHPMWVFDTETHRFLAVNDAAIARYGYSVEEFLSMTIQEIRTPEEVERLQQHLAGLHDVPALGELWRHRTKDGTVIEVQVSANALRFDGRPARLVLAQDVTERRTLEAQLRQAQRLEAVGRLAGGVAHDFNNVLTVVIGSAELLQLRLAADDQAAADLDSILDAAQRASGLTRQLLALSRQQVLRPIVVDPNEMIVRVQGLLGRVIGEDISFQTDLSAATGAIMVDPGQFEQVLLNLAVNARDAMPAGGRLTISTQAVDLDELGAALHGLTQTGRFVVIAVADSGIGMTAEVRLRIFDPFFTTKEVGRGTGLGLATVYGIVSQSGGSITVYSEPGIGSTFNIYFPRVDAPVTATAAVGEPAAVSGHETILLVEDEEAVRQSITRALESLGYTVMAAASGEAALEVAARHQGALDLVVSDIVMPGIDGPTLVARLRERRPGLKSLLLSGYSADAVANRGYAQANVTFLQKPFSRANLSHKVREALEARSTSSTGGSTTV